MRMAPAGLPLDLRFAIAYSLMLCNHQPNTTLTRHCEEIPVAADGWSERLERVRRALKYSQAKLATEWKVNQTRVSRWESTDDWDTAPDAEMLRLVKKWIQDNEPRLTF